MSDPNSQDLRRDPPFSATLRAPFLFRDRCPIPEGDTHTQSEIICKKSVCLDLGKLFGIQSQFSHSE